MGLSRRYIEPLQDGSLSNNNWGLKWQALYEEYVYDEIWIVDYYFGSLSLSLKKILVPVTTSDTFDFWIGN